MTLSNVRLILAREIRDQSRDRRTLFMVFVLPVLLYPLLGTTYFEVVQFQSQKPMSVLVVGSEQLQKGLQKGDSPHLPERPEGCCAQMGTVPFLPPLIEDGHFSPALFMDGRKAAQLLTLDTASDPAFADRMVRARRYDAALVFPPDFAQRMEAFRKRIQEETASARSTGFSRNPDKKSAEAGTPTALPEIPRPKIIYTAANERSLTAFNRLTSVLDRWTEEIGKANLVAGGLPAEAVRPFEIDADNLAGETVTKATNVWSRMLPVLLLLWAMTGAFYPAIDLCAGEKERGTLETLLSSPAERSEIVLGKLLTIMIFSMVTAALNLICVGATGSLIFRQLAGFGGPPVMAVLWLTLAMVPVSALFSALCLALASFARSTKEGQYYLMPLMMLSLPLAVLPMSPGVELNLGNSLLPLTGIVLLLKTVLEGDYLHALQYLPIVLAVTLGACWLAVRWAIEQFNSESVLFREGERFSLGLWLKHLRRDRGPLPTVAEGLFCGVLVLMLGFVFRTVMPTQDSFAGFAWVTLAMQVATLLVPALLMAVFLTSRPRQTLLVKLPRWRMVPAAALLAVALNPFVAALGSLVVWLYPMAPEVQAKLDELQGMFTSGNVWTLLLLIAALPAVCEELAFRGFILSGLRSQGNNRRAIVLSALFFGIAHGILQQSINTFAIGLVLGWLAVQSGSLLPGMVFHFLNNALMVLAAKVTPELIARHPVLGVFVHPTAGGPSYQWPVYVLCGVIGLVLLAWFAWFQEGRKADGVAQETYHPTRSIEGVAG